MTDKILGINREHDNAVESDDLQKYPIRKSPPCPTVGEADRMARTNHRATFARRCGQMTSSRDYWQDEYRDREHRKHAANEAYEAGRLSSLEHFKIISKTWYEREPDRVRERVDLREYRRELVRAHAGDADLITDEVRRNYLPAMGLVHILPGGSDWHLKPLKTKNPDGYSTK